MTVNIPSQALSDKQETPRMFLAIDAILIGNLNIVLKVVENWLEKDAPHTHPNKNVRAVLAEVRKARLQLIDNMNASMAAARKSNSVYLDKGKENAGDKSGGSGSDIKDDEARLETSGME